MPRLLLVALLTGVTWCAVVPATAAYATDDDQCYDVGPDVPASPYQPEATVCPPPSGSVIISGVPPIFP